MGPFNQHIGGGGPGRWVRNRRSGRRTPPGGGPAAGAAVTRWRRRRRPGTPPRGSGGWTPSSSAEAWGEVNGENWLLAREGEEKGTVATSGVASYSLVCGYRVAKRAAALKLAKLLVHANHLFDNFLRQNCSGVTSKVPVIHSDLHIPF